jgi:hypothetical protein
VLDEKSTRLGSGLRFAAGHGTIVPSTMTDPIQTVPARSDVPTPLAVPAPDGSMRHSWKQLALAFAIAAVSDAVSFWATLVPPVQWAIDLATAFCLFLILGRRWALLPGLIAEAIPGMGVFPVWILVVASVAVYDDIKARRT